MFREVKRITDVISSWCMNVGLMVETSYKGDNAELELSFRKNSRDENPFNLVFDMRYYNNTDQVINIVKREVKVHYNINEFFNFDALYPRTMAAKNYADLSSDKRRIPTIKDVIFNGPATIVFWTDNTKTVVKCQEGDDLDPEKGLAMAIAKKSLGNKGNFNDEFKKWLPDGIR